MILSMGGIEPGAFRDFMVQFYIKIIGFPLVLFNPEWPHFLIKGDPPKIRFLLVPLNILIQSALILLVWKAMSYL